VFGAVLGDAGYGTSVLDDLIRRLGVAPDSDVRRPGTHRQTKSWLAEGPEPGDEPTYLRSEFFRAPIPAADLVARLIGDRRPGEARELDFNPWGGAYNRVAPDATAFPHRDARFLLKHSATGDAGEWLEGSFTLAHPYGTGGAYPNFPEPGRPDSAFHGANTERLHRIRAGYDPDGRFAAG